MRMDLGVGKVLLIEDDLELSEMVKAFFRQKDIEIDHTADPVAAIEIVSKQPLEYGAIISDLNLPNLSGLDFIEKMVSEGKEIPIILVTVSTDVDTATKAIAAGAFDFVVKPIPFPQLHLSVQRALRYSRLRSENAGLREVLRDNSLGHSLGIVGKSAAIKKSFEIAKRVANSAATVLITGESGTGKEVFAKAIHQMSDRSGQNFIAINCSAIPEQLLESELFGHAKGAFTGAIEKKRGLISEADGGTLFLDEIGDIPMPLQAKLLRVIQDRKIKPVGENKYLNIDVRILAATHKNLREEVKHNRFREDLFFRLNVIPLTIPPLRDRPEDILPLSNYFLKKYSLINKARVTGFSRAATEYLLSHKWPGNVRELENAVERAVVLSQNTEIQVLDLMDPSELNGSEGAGVAEHLADLKSNSFKSEILNERPIEPLASIEKNYIEYALQRFEGAKEQTAKALGIDRKTLYRKLKTYSSPDNATTH